MKILDLGCGERKHSGAIGLDKYPFKGVDIIHDMDNLPLPFADNCFDIVVALHSIEHIKKESFIPLIEDIYRILKPRGVLKVYVPYCVSRDGYGCPQHNMGFNADSFDIFLISTRRDYGFGEDFLTYAKFALRDKHFYFVHHRSRFRLINAVMNPLLNLCHTFTEKFFPYVINEIFFEMEVVK